MLINRVVKLFFLLLLFTSTLSVYADKKDTLVHFSGKVYQSKIETDKKITYKNAIFKLVKTSLDFFTSDAAQNTQVSYYVDDKLIYSDTVKSDGSFSYDLKYGKDYRITFSKADYYITTILVNTDSVPLKSQKKGQSILAELEVIKEDKRIKQFTFPLAKYYFDNNENSFVQDQEHSQYVVEELEKIRIELTKAIIVEKEVSRLSEEAKQTMYDYIQEEKRKADAQSKGIVAKAKLKADSIINYAENYSQQKIIESPYQNRFNKTYSTDTTSISGQSDANVDFSDQADMDLIMGGSIQFDTKKDQVENARKALELAKLKATTKMDSLLIIEREAKILAAENQILQAEQKLNDAEKELELKNSKIEQDKLQRNALYLGLLLVLVFAFIQFRSVKRKKEDNKIILQQKLEVEEQHKEIKDSINYAQRIQSALLASKSEWDKISHDYFVFFKPRDVVSGDFFWAHHDEELNVSVWATADCTGHGVPGAFMSVLGIGFLNEIVIEGKQLQPDKILNELRKKIINALIKNEGDVEQKDGMDISICVLDRNTNKLQFAGANNSILILKHLNNLSEEHINDRKTLLNDMGGKAIIELKADKQPVGMHAELKPFNTSTIDVHEGDVVISFTDGYPDQFGGEKGKKLKYKPFKELFLDNQFENLTHMKSHLEFSFNNWKGELEQIDDVCVVAVKV